MKKLMVGSVLAIAICCCTGNLKAQQVYSLKFDPNSYKTQTANVSGKTITVRAFEHLVDVQKPVDTAYEQLNIYIPEAYFNGGTINGYTAATAPIFFPNQVGGYMPGKPGTLIRSGSSGPGGPPPPPMPPGQGAPARGNGPGPGPNFGSRPNTIAEALAMGYVVASPGARGRTNKDANGKYDGKAPAAIIDLKAAVRYLKLNDALMPGDANKIISNGTSAGGALSALLGATGDSPEYLPYLKAIGAAETSDAIFATSAYCPITNLDHADIAYEWQFYGVNSFVRGGPPARAGSSNTASTLNDDQIKVSADLKSLFPAYINSLHLKDAQGNELNLDEAGNGSFKNLIKSVVIASANKAIAGGADLSKHEWLHFENGKVTDLDWDAYIRYMQRQKTPPAFDALDFSSPETNLFGTESINNSHFTDYGQQHSKVDGSTKADQQVVKLMNPMYYIGTDGTKTSKYWRIRHGSKDKDTGLAISAALATLLENKGFTVDYALPWDRPHSGDYDLPELFAWIDGIAR